MFEFLPKEVRDGLETVRKRDQRARSRLCVHVGGEVFPVLRLWGEGFALEAAGAPRMRGLINLYDGPKHLSECLVIASVEENGEMICEFKRQTPAADRPALDFYRAEGIGPIALLSHDH